MPLLWPTLSGMGGGVNKIPPGTDAANTNKLPLLPLGPGAVSYTHLPLPVSAMTGFREKGPLQTRERTLAFSIHMVLTYGFNVLSS